MLAHECEHCYSYKLEHKYKKIKIRIGQGLMNGRSDLLTLLNYLLILRKMRNDVINMSQAQDKEKI